MWMPLFLSYLARANAESVNSITAWGQIGEAMTAMKTTKETWYEAEINRVAGEIALLGANPDVARRKLISPGRSRSRESSRRNPGSFERNEHGAAPPRSGQPQGRPRRSGSGLRLVHQGFDTLDLREAKTLLDELGADLADHQRKRDGIS